MDVIRQHGRILRLLNSGPKRKLQQLVPEFSQKTATATSSDLMEREARQLLKRYYPRASATEMDVLVFCLLGMAAEQTGKAGSKSTPIRPAGRDRLRTGRRTDQPGDSSQTSALRLQMAAARRTKLLITMSSIMKQISDTADTVISNLK